jgi:hypothetical protein
MNKRNILKKFIFSAIVVFVFTEYSFANEETSNSKENKHLVKSFCYSLQAASICDNLNMRIDTEGKIEAKIGEKFRNQTSVYSSDCWAGLNKAFEEENKGLCAVAWKKYGCSGTDIPRLIQENPFKIKNGNFCKY